MVERPQVTMENVDAHVSELRAKILSRLNKKGYGVFVGPHEVLGILTEEFHELVDAVKSDNLYDVRAELLDIAVGALFGVVSIDRRLEDVEKNMVQDANVGLDFMNLVADSIKEKT
jgi:NTP pyrophosphatase (non-canonical NTP hydrolase)